MFVAYISVLRVRRSLCMKDPYKFPALNTPLTRRSETVIGPIIER